MRSEAKKCWVQAGKHAGLILTTYKLSLLISFFNMQGCLKPVQVIIPKGSILDPSDTAAVVGGNVLTSQRITDVVFRAFETCAASQGCMNNITFGDEEVGYYETVAGGAGAVSANYHAFSYELSIATHDTIIHKKTLLS